MKLHILGSGSSGNGYILHAADACLLIEAGVPLMEVKKALDFDLRNIKGLFCSHAHGDHFGKIHEYLNAGIPCHISESMITASVVNKSRFLPLLYEEGHIMKVGQFHVMPFRAVHDVECHGFMIDHPESGVIIFLTDSHYTPFRFKGINHLLVEANFDQDILDDNILNGRIPAVVRNRVMKSHMSLQTVKELLAANNLSKTRNIILLHLSSGNSNAAKFKSEIEGMTGIPVTIADHGVTVDLNSKPF